MISLGGIVMNRILTIPQSKIRDFCQPPLHKGAFIGSPQRGDQLEFVYMHKWLRKRLFVFDPKTNVFQSWKKVVDFMQLKCYS